MVDNYVLMSGASQNISGIICKQPTLGEILKNHEVGYEEYSTYLFAIGMTVDKFLELNGLTERFAAISPEVKENISALALMVVQPSWRALLVKALGFFVDGAVRYDAENNCIVVSAAGGEIQITDEIFIEMRRFIYQSACMEIADEKPAKFYNETAKRIYEESKRIKANQVKTKKSHDVNLELWNVIGAVCVKHPSYNLINIWQLTIYQLYDQFFRLQSDVQFNTIAHRWAVWGKEQFDFSLWFKKNQSNQ